MIFLVLDFSIETGHREEEETYWFVGHGSLSLPPVLRSGNLD